MKKIKLIIAFSILLFALLLLGVVVEGDWLQDKFPSLPTLTDIIGGDTVITSRDGTLSKLAKLARKAVKISKAGLRRGWRLKREEADKEAAGKKEDVFTFAKSIGVATEPISTKKSTEKAAVTSKDATISTSDKKTTQTISTAKPKDESFWATTTRQPASTPEVSTTQSESPSSETITPGGEESAPTSDDTTEPPPEPESEEIEMPSYEDWLQHICLCLSQKQYSPMILGFCANQISNNLGIPFIQFDNDNYIGKFNGDSEAPYPLCCNVVYTPKNCCKYPDYFNAALCCLTDDDCIGIESCTNKVCELPLTKGTIMCPDGLCFTCETRDTNLASCSSQSCSVEDECCVEGDGGDPSSCEPSYLDPDACKPACTYVQCCVCRPCSCSLAEPCTFPGQCCLDGTCVDYCPLGQCYLDGTCVDVNDCLSLGKCCLDGTCADNCLSDQCCIDGMCVPPECSLDNPCPKGQECMGCKCIVTVYY